MKQTVAALALAFVLTPFAAHAAPSHVMQKTVMLHLSGKYRGMSGFKHVMASAKLHYTQHDVTISLTTDGLPRPATLGKRAYVLYAVDGSMSERVGALQSNGMMAAVRGQVMMTMVKDLYVYAVNSPIVKHPHGMPILSAMV